MGMKVGFYGRQSVLRTKDDERRDLDTSTDRHVTDGFVWVRSQGGEVVRTYRDEGISGYSGALRPEFERLLTDLDDRVVDTVVCWKLDRLARNHATSSGYGTCASAAAPGWSASTRCPTAPPRPASSPSAC
jgi:DNA invertase Pin-like site-specific DNA recombinase